MDVKIIDKDKIPGETRRVFLEFLDKTEKEFHDEVFKFLDNLYTLKRAMTYDPSSRSAKICCYMLGSMIILQLVCTVNAYINIMIYNIGSWQSVFLPLIALIFQLALLLIVLFNNMINDPIYKDNCFKELLKSNIAQKYYDKITKKAKELDIKLEFNKGEKDEIYSSRK